MFQKRTIVLYQYDEAETPCHSLLQITSVVSIIKNSPLHLLDTLFPKKLFFTVLIFRSIAGYTFVFVSFCAVHVEHVSDVFPCYTYYGKLLSPIITTNQIILTTIFGGTEIVVPSFLVQLNLT